MKVSRIYPLKSNEYLSFDEKEIVKALECASTNPTKCGECPYHRLIEEYTLGCGRCSFAMLDAAMLIEYLCKRTEE